MTKSKDTSKLSKNHTFHFLMFFKFFRFFSFLIFLIYFLFFSQHFKIMYVLLNIKCQFKKTLKQISIGFILEYKNIGSVF